MKAVVAIDSLKGSLSSLEAGDAIREGILKADSKANVVVRPLADGGEGTVEALTLGMGGTMQRVDVTGPLGETVSAEYGILHDGHTAVLEMSQAAGILPYTWSSYRRAHRWRRSYRNCKYYGFGRRLNDVIRSQNNHKRNTCRCTY